MNWSIKIVQVILIVIVFSSLSMAQWRQTDGPYFGGQINTLAVSGTSTFVGTNRGMFLSTNYGAQWTQFGLGTFIYGVNSIVIDTTGADGSKIFAGSYLGVHVSTNNGRSWDTTSLKNKYVCFLVSRGGNVVAGTQTDGIYISTDSGKNWSPVNAGLPFVPDYNKTTTALAIVPNGDEGNIIVAGFSGQGLFMSSDNGVHWIRSDSGLTANQDTVRDIYALASHPDGKGGSILFACGGVRADGEVYVSTNNGNSWRKTGFSMKNILPRAIAIEGKNIFVSTEEMKGEFDSYKSGSIFRSTDEGNTWSPVNTGLIYTLVKTLAINPNRPGSPAIFAGTPNTGIFVSSNNGDNWNVCNTGIAYPDIKYLITAPDGMGSSYLFAGAWAGGIFRSSNKGGTWLPINGGMKNHTVKALCAKSRSMGGSILFAGITMLDKMDTLSGIYRSTDNGESWTASNNGLPHDAPKVLFTDGRNLYGSNGTMVYTSSDDGAHWDTIHTGLTNKNISCFALSPDSTLLFAAANKFYVDYYTPPLEGAIYCSTNRGKNWITIDSSLSSKSVNALAVCSNGKGVNYIFAGTGAGIFSSTDNGTSWKQSMIDFDGISSFASIADGKGGTVLFASTSGKGIYFTTNYGSTWKSAGYSLNAYSIYTLATNGTDIYAGTISGVVRADLADIVPSGAVVLTLNLPAGSEKYTAGSTRLITWTSGNADTVRLEYSLNDGQSWNLIVENLLSEPPCYPWFVPSSVSNECRVRIREKNNSQTFSMSKNRFSIAIDELSDKLIRVADTSVAGYILGLEAFGTRNARENNRDSVVDWIEARFTESGITNVTTDSFAVYGVSQKNIIATIVGSDASSGEIIVGAHYDSINWDNDGAPGADDNASGSAAVLEMARVVQQSGYRPKKTFRFICFGAEEYGLLGSEDYAQKAKKSGQKILLMQNYDMIGNHIKVFSERPVTVTWYNGSEKEAALDSMLLCRYTTLLPRMSTVHQSSSDSWSFFEAGFNTVYTSEWDFSPYYHSVGDRSTKLDITYAAEIIRAGLAQLLTKDAEVPNGVAQVQQPSTWALEQNYPNPFNPATSIMFSLLVASDVSIAVYDVLGREVAILVNEKKSAGRYTVQWDASRFSSGLYFYSITAGRYRETKRMLLLK